MARMNVFATITKNSIKKFPRTLYQDIFPKMGDDDILVVVENNSTDGTKDFLRDLVRERKVKWIEDDLSDPPQFPPVAIKERADFLAERRQKCVDWVIESKLEPEYFVMFDSDMASIPDQNWDSMFTENAAVGSNGLDIWSRDQKSVEACQYDTWSRLLLNNDEVKYGRDLIAPDDPSGLQEVRSVFGGVAVYRWDFVKKSQYHWIATPNATEDERYKNSGLCEHGGLHADIRKLGGKVFINTEYYPIRNANNCKVN